MRVFSNGIALSVLVLLAPMAADAEEYTYGFTGNFTAGGPTGASQTLSGTYTFDLLAANPSQGFGTIGSSNSGWESQLYGGPVYGLSASTVPTALVFSSTITSGSFSYDGTIAGTYSNQSYVYGNPYQFSAFEGNFAPPPSQYPFASEPDLSEINLYSAPGLVPFTSDGLPNFANVPVGAGTGYVTISGHSENSYEITSLTLISSGPSQPYIPPPIAIAAPEIDPALAASGLILLLGGLTVMRGRRSKEQFPVGAV